jgi:hypothetical protein
MSKTQEAELGDAEATAEPGSPSVNEEWEDVKTGLGREHDFDKGPLVAFFVGREEVDLREPREDGRTTADAFIFADEETGEQVFAWGSHELREALAQISEGDKVRIEYLGTESFTGAKGPQNVKRYKVQRARRA